MTREEFSTQLEKAIKAYRANPDHCANARDLRMVAGLALKTFRDLASVGPALGIIDGVSELHSHDLGLIARAGIWFLKRYSLTPDRPGWNDYWMARWRVTRNPACADEIHRRACHLVEWPAVAETAQWMVGSYRTQDSDFDAAMNSALLRCSECAGGP